MWVDDLLRGKLRAADGRVASGILNSLRLMELLRVGEMAVVVGDHHHEGGKGGETEAEKGRGRNEESKREAIEEENRGRREEGKQSRWKASERGCCVARMKIGS